MSDTASDVQRRALEWIFSGDTGLSSKAICAHMLGVKCRSMHDYPSDPSDLGRCLRLLRVIPEWLPRITEMASYSPGWAGLAKKWNELSESMINEVGIDWEKGDRAPLTYHAMHIAQADGYRADSRYKCTFSKDGHLQSAFRDEDESPDT